MRVVVRWDHWAKIEQHLLRTVYRPNRLFRVAVVMNDRRAVCTRRPDVVEDRLPNIENPTAKRLHDVGEGFSGLMAVHDAHAIRDKAASVAQVF